MSRNGRLLAALVLLLLGCGSEERALVGAPRERTPVEQRHAECFGGRQVSPLPIAAVYEPPRGWVLGRAELGRCEGSNAPMVLRVIEEGRGAPRELGSVTLEPSRGAARRSVAWIARLQGDIRYELSDPSSTGAAAAFLDVSWASLRERPSAVPEATELVFAGAITLDDGSLDVRGPARLRIRAWPGVHTLSGRLFNSASPVDVRVAQVGAEDPPWMAWELDEPGSVPFTVTFLSTEASAFELRSEGDEDTTITWSALRHDSRVLPPTRRVEVPDPPAEPEPPPRDDVGLLFSEVEAAGGVGTVARCAGRPAYLAPASSRLVLAAGPARRLRGRIGPCAPTTPGHAIWRVLSGSGDELWSRELSWEPGDAPSDWFDLALAAGRQAVLVTEGDEGAPTAWIEPRAALALVVDRIEGSGFAESELNRLYAPDKAFDGDPSTEWVASDGAPSWIELRLAEPVAIRGVALLGGHNPGYDDRGTGRFTIRAFAGDAVVAELQGSFSRLSPRPEWVAFPVRAEGVDRIHVEVHTHHGVGAAIAEVELL